jgi:hypothetical protein
MKEPLEEQRFIRDNRRPGIDRTDTIHNIYTYNHMGRITLKVIHLTLEKM